MLINDTEYLLFIVDEDCGKFEDGNSGKIYWELGFQEFNLTSLFEIIQGNAC